MKSARWRWAAVIGVGVVFSVTRHPLGPSNGRCAGGAGADVRSDPFCRALPNHWVTGSTIGLSVDGR